MTNRSVLRRIPKWALGVAVVSLVALVVAPYTYINFIKADAPPPLSLEDVPVGTDEGAVESGAVASATSGGNWVVGEGSQAGYRVKEILFGQSTEGVGRTDAVSGSLTLEGAQVSEANFAVDLTTVTSDEAKRDNQFRGRIMQTDSFPTAAFTLTEPLDLAAEPVDGETIQANAIGTFTIRGETQEVSFPLEGRRSGERLEITASIPVVFADYGIPDPSFGPAEVEDHGEIEVLLVLLPA